nr:helix-turn-helix domain-containing protein [uncultured Pantoea sp.]
MYVATTKQSRNFVKAYHDVLSDPRFNLNDKLVYLTLLSYQEAGVQVFPSNAKIAESLGVSESSVKRSTSTLEKSGFISKNRRFNKTNLVTVNKWVVQNDPSIRSNCTVQTAQNEPSRQVKMTSYKNNDKNKDKISLEEEGQKQDASLSRDDDLHSPNVRIVTDGSDQIMSKEEEEEEAKPVVMKADPVLDDDEPLDDELPDSVDDEDYFEPDDNSDFIDDDEVTYHNEQRSEERNQQITKHFSTAPTREEYKRMLSGNRVSQYKHKPAKPAWMQ